jgi:hypothetical protein
MPVSLTIFVNILQNMQHFLKCWNDIFSFFNLQPVRPPRLAGMARQRSSQPWRATRRDTSGAWRAVHAKEEGSRGLAIAFLILNGLLLGL